MEFLDGYNKQQAEAILATNGPVLILAGAGSGKTRVVTGKIAYLIDQKGVPASSILAITFTNKAAKEMKDRVGALLSRDVSHLWIGTFHSICVRILRKNIDRIGYDSNFSIYDQADQLTLVRDCMKDLNLSKETYKERNILSRISHWKNEDLPPKEAVKMNYGELYERNIALCYELYERKKKSNNALDFDDLLIETVHLLREKEDIRLFYQEKFQHIFVDEYQDTNRIQYLFIQYICGKRPNLTVVGDNDQSIYKWRGADMENILNFEKDFPDAKVILLEQNYRSTNEILTAANALISHNSNRKDKSLWTDKGQGQRVVYKEFGHNIEEERGVIQKIQQLNYKGKPYGSIAILYRTNAQSRGFEDILIREGIPYRVLGGLRFYDRKEIKDILSYLKAISNPNDEVSLERIINVPKRGIGDSTLVQIKDYADRNNMAMYEVMESLDDLKDLSLRSHKSVKKFANLMILLRQRSKNVGIRELVEDLIFESQYGEELEKEKTVEARTRLENIQEFVSVAAQYELENPEADLAEFLNTLSLVTDRSEEKDLSNAVTLMTIHGAKGLEFPIVFVVGLEERLFPTGRAFDNEEDMEEERRLMYVAITRAEQELYLSSAKTRTLYGNVNRSLRSRFIEELGDNIDHIVDEKKELEQASFRQSHSYDLEKSYERAKKQEEKRSQIQEAGKHTKTSFRVGDTIIHKKWGQGMIVQIKDQESQEAVITFEGKGLKTLKLSIAPIRKKED